MNNNSIINMINDLCLTWPGCSVDLPSGSINSDAFLNASSNGLLLSSLNRPISSQFRRNLVGVGVWSEVITKQRLFCISKNFIIGFILKQLL